MATKLWQALHGGRVLLMDGAMGTELQRAGLGAGECYERWNLTHPERVLAIHQSYVAAGAEVLLTNTFQANPTALARHGLEQQLQPVREAGVALARKAVGPDRLVLGDLAPFEPPWVEVATGWESADGLLLETCSDVATTLALAKVNSGPPLLLSITFHRNNAGVLETFHGMSPETVAELAASAMPAALGVNCGRDISLVDCATILRRYRSVSNLPLFARPNAGTPIQVDGRWVYPHTPRQMASGLPALLEAGAIMIGGCCGTTPEHIAAFRPVIAAWNALAAAPRQDPDVAV